VAGSDAELRRLPDYARLARRGAQAHLLVFVQGARVMAYDGHRLRAVPSARVAVWATEADESGRLLMAVAGLDAASARRAAAAIARDPALLAGRYAAALDASGRVVASGGR